MTVRSWISQQMMLPGLDSDTSSPASADGATRSDWQEFQMTLTSGPGRVPVSHSPQPERAAGLPTSDTSGPRGSGSSASADLQSFLANRLRALTDCAGSTLFSLTWKERATPSGRQICALRASVPRTVASDSGSWPTPTTSDSSDSARHGYADDGRPRSAQRPQRASLTGHSGTTLTDAARMAGWPTPVREDSESTGVRPVTETRLAPSHTLTRAARLRAIPRWRATDNRDCTSDSHRRGQLGQAARLATSQPHLAGWQTPRSEISGDTPETHEARQARVVARHGRRMGTPLEVQAGWATPVATEIGNTLENYQAMKANMKSGPRTAITHPSLQAQLAAWPTPQTDNFRSRSGDRAEEMGMDQMARTIGTVRITATGEMLTGSPAETASGGQLSPAHSRWLMGYPVAWDACAPTATRSSRKSPPRSSAPRSMASSEEDDRDAP